MAQNQADIDEALLSYALASSVVTALEAEALRTELKRRRSTQKDMTMQSMMVYKGIVTKEQCQALISRMEAGAAPGPVGPVRATRVLRPSGPVAGKPPSPPRQTRPINPQPPRTLIPESSPSPAMGAPTLVPDGGQNLGAPTLIPDGGRGLGAPTLVPTGPSPNTGDATLVPDSGAAHAGVKGIEATDIDEEEEVTSTVPPQGNQPVETVIPADPDAVAANEERTTNRVKAKEVRPTARHTSRVDDSRPTGRTTSKKVTVKAGSGVTMWAYEGATDELGATDKLVPAGTIIQASEVTIAQVRHQMGIHEGVKLVSDKMGSALAQFQPDAAADKKRYIVIREIARGGMGKVLEVEDTELRRSVALKVLRKELLGRRDVVERFLEEAQITGQLEHPNIVPVHEMGVDGAGNLYFTMKYVEGLSLSEVLLKLREGNRDTRRDYPLLKLLDIFIKICEGMAFAHNRGVIHRDLKPANIMVGKFGEVQVMDWGVGKVVGKELKRPTDKVVLTDRLEGGAAHTMVGAVIGTPSYMSPEQARGEIDQMGPSTDIFSLGIILYEMLALRSPWTGRTADEVLDEVREKAPQKPSLRNPEAEVPAELERLCMRCLEKDPQDRVETAKELADNVRSFIEGRALGAVEYSLFRLAAKWVNRHRKEVLGVAMMILLLAGGIVGTVWYMEVQESESVKELGNEGARLLDQWEADAEAGNFEKAELIVDEARERFQRVLAANPMDITANAGMTNVKASLDKIRSLRLAAEEKSQRQRRLADLNTRALRSLQAAESERHLSLAQPHLLRAIAEADSVLVEDPRNERALETKALAALDIARRALKDSTPKWDIAELYLSVLESTGLKKEQHEALAFELRRRRPG